MKDFLKIGDSEYRVEANWNAIAGFAGKREFLICLSLMSWYISL